MCVFFTLACGNIIVDCTRCTQDGAITKCTACANSKYPSFDGTFCAGKCSKIDVLCIFMFNNNLYSYLCDL